MLSTWSHPKFCRLVREKNKKQTGSNPLYLGKALASHIEIATNIKQTNLNADIRYWPLISRLNSLYQPTAYWTIPN